MFNVNKKLCYLVGQISSKYPITYDWRKYIIEEMLDFKEEISFINPCANRFNKEVLNKKEYAVTECYRSSGIDILPHKDYTFVLESNIAIADMNQYDPHKPLIGSFFELAWYFTRPEKTVIGYAQDLNSYTCQHPFVKQAVSTWCNTTEEAVFLLKKYFIN